MSAVTLVFLVYLPDDLHQVGEYLFCQSHSQHDREYRCLVVHEILLMDLTRSEVVFHHSHQVSGRRLFGVYGQFITVYCL